MHTGDAFIHFRLSRAGMLSETALIADSTHIRSIFEKAFFGLLSHAAADLALENETDGGDGSGGGGGAPAGGDGDAAAAGADAYDVHSQALVRRMPQPQLMALSQWLESPTTAGRFNDMLRLVYFVRLLPQMLTLFKMCSKKTKSPRPACVNPRSWHSVFLLC